MRSTAPAASTTERSYRALVAVPSFPQLWGAGLLGRIGNSISAVALVLFVLERFSSPVLAGLTLLFATLPGVLIAPIAGALLDRSRRIRLIAIDYAVASVSLAAVGVLGITGALTPTLLLLIVGVAALTGPLSNAGTRSLYPVMVPRALWDRANAFDSGGYVIAQLLGPPLAGVLVAAYGGPVALLCDAALYAAALVVVTRLPEPQLTRAGHGRLLPEALGALLYVVRNRTLAVLALTLALFNSGFGIVMIALPVLVLQRLHGGDSEVGVLLAVMAMGGIVASFFSGRIDSDGREWQLIAAGCLGSAVGFLVLAGADSALAAAVAMLIVGVCNGPLDIGLFSLRQRATDPLWMGRAFAVSASLNFAGYPLGSAIGGPIVERTVAGGAIAAAVGAVIAALVAVFGLPHRVRRRL